MWHPFGLTNQLGMCTTQSLGCKCISASFTDRQFQKWAASLPAPETSQELKTSVTSANLKCNIHVIRKSAHWPGVVSGIGIQLVTCVPPAMVHHMAMIDRLCTTQAHCITQHPWTRGNKPWQAKPAPGQIGTRTSEAVSLRIDSSSLLRCQQQGAPLASPHLTHLHPATSVLDAVR
jgi:hypothetical protein